MRKWRVFILWHDNETVFPAFGIDISFRGRNLCSRGRIAQFGGVLVNANPTIKRME